MGNAQLPITLAAVCQLLFANCSTPKPGGSVRFSGFSRTALTDFRVVPEEGVRLLQPKNGRRYPADGFWWRHDSGRWFKIPDHCHTGVTPDPDGARESDFVPKSGCHPTGTLLQNLRGLSAEPAFVPDTGSTGHPTSWPWRGSGAR